MAKKSTSQRSARGPKIKDQAETSVKKAASPDASGRSEQAPVDKPAAELRQPTAAERGGGSGSDIAGRATEPRQGAGRLFIIILVIIALVVGAVAGAAVGPKVGLAHQLSFSSLPLIVLVSGALIVGGLLGAIVVAAFARRKPANAADRASALPSSGAGAVSASSSALLKGHFDWNRHWVVAAVTIAGILLLLVIGVVIRDVAPVAAALLLICGTLTLCAGLFGIEAIGRGEGLQFDSHWGGLGGGLGGLRMSTATTLILLSLIFLVATFVASSGAMAPGVEPGRKDAAAAAPPVNRPIQRPASVASAPAATPTP